jgi:hypothetical protein
MEGKMPRKKNAKTIAQWRFEEIICCFGCIPQFTVDNGSEFQGNAQTEKPSQVLLYSYKILQSSSRGGVWLDVNGSSGWQDMQQQGEFDVKYSSP